MTKKSPKKNREINRYYVYLDYNGNHFHKEGDKKGRKRVWEYLAGLESGYRREYQSIQQKMSRAARIATNIEAVFADIDKPVSLQSDRIDSYCTLKDGPYAQDPALVKIQGIMRYFFLDIRQKYNADEKEFIQKDSRGFPYSILNKFDDRSLTETDYRGIVEGTHPEIRSLYDNERIVLERRIQDIERKKDLEMKSVFPEKKTGCLSYILKLFNKR